MSWLRGLRFLSKAKTTSEPGPTGLLGDHLPIEVFVGGPFDTFFVGGIAKIAFGLRATRPKSSEDDHCNGEKSREDLAAVQLHALH